MCRDATAISISSVGKSNSSFNNHRERSISSVISSIMSTSITSGATQLGTGMVNSKYNSQTTRQDNPDVSGDDYRSQIFPAGTREEVTTYYLEARKE